MRTDAISYGTGRGRELTPSELERHPEFFDSIIFVALDGSCVPLSRRFAVTAAHVIESNRRNEQRYPGAGALSAVLFSTVAGKRRCCKIVDSETFLDSDLGIIELDLEEGDEAGALLPWSSRKLGTLADVSSFGFVDQLGCENRAQIPCRGFKGYVMCSAQVAEFSGRLDGYELSYPAPPGLSGGPLITGRGGNMVVSGIVIGNRSSEIANLDGSTETFSRALAVSAEAVMAILSKLLGKTIREYLDEQLRVVT